MTFRVELGDVSATKLPFIVAADSGIFARNGIAPELFITPTAEAIATGNGFAIPPALVQTGVVGEINIGGGSGNTIRQITNATTPRRIILATNDITAPFHLYVRGNIQSIADLKGKRVGYMAHADLTHFQYRALAQRMGWDPELDWSEIHNVHGIRTADRAGVDAYLFDPTAHEEAMKLGYRDLGDLTAFKIPVFGSGINVLTSWLSEHRQEAAAFIRSTVEGVAVVLQDKATTVAAMEKWYGLTNPKIQDAIYDFAVRVLRPKPYPFVEGLELLRALFKFRELRIHPNDYFLDPSFVAELDRSGFIDSLYAKKS